jgi:hypothetical protein
MKARRSQKRHETCAPMTYQQLLAVLARDELGHLRREKSRQLGTLPLDGGEQTRVRKHDRRLIGERLHQHDLLVGEPLRFAPNHDDHADHVVVEQNRHPEKARYGIGPEYAYSVSSRISGMFTGARVTAVRPATVVRSSR